ncbi:MAG: methyltransferase domain-containing protein [Candidatus Scalindua sp.]|jgi:hypothetical protein|nr:methyltransferase domain-containing protein [Candidatus Scalindua sp.]
MKINFGSGEKPLPGYINVDMSEKCNPDFVWDVRNTPFPEEWVGADRIEADNIFEHIEAETLIKVINECNRVLKPGGELWIRVPELREGNLMPCFTDPTHVNYFTEQTFGYYIKGHQRHERFGKDYNIIGWSSREQIKNGIFLEITLKK